MTQLPLPISPADALAQIIVPALDEIESYNGPALRCDRAKALLLAIAMQESGLRNRMQIRGPARGLWQFEPGGVEGVLSHERSGALASYLCVRHGVTPAVPHVYGVLEHNDILAAGFARLLVWTLSICLPRLDDEQGAWEQYIAAWRPGSPSHDRWAQVYPVAVATVRAAAS